MAERALTPLEEAGWRSYWDGWSACPKCVAAKEAKLGRPWAVPANYNYVGIKPGARCADCRAVAPDDHTGSEAPGRQKTTPGGQGND